MRRNRLLAGSQFILARGKEERGHCQQTQRGCHPELKKGDTHDDPGTVICGPRPGLAAVERAGRWQGDGREVAATVKGRIWGPSGSGPPGPSGAVPRLHLGLQPEPTDEPRQPVATLPFLGPLSSDEAIINAAACLAGAVGIGPQARFISPTRPGACFGPSQHAPRRAAVPLAVQSVAHGRTWSIVRLWMQTRDGRVGGLTFLTLSAGWMRCDVLSRRTPVPRHPSQEPCQGPRPGTAPGTVPRPGTVWYFACSPHFPASSDRPLSTHTRGPHPRIHASTHPRKQAPTLLRSGAANQPQPAPTHSLPTPPLSTLVTIRCETCVVLCPVGPGSVGLGRAGHCTLTCSTLARPPTFRG